MAACHGLLEGISIMELPFLGPMLWNPSQLAWRKHHIWSAEGWSSNWRITFTRPMDSFLTLNVSRVLSTLWTVVLINAEGSFCHVSSYSRQANGRSGAHLFQSRESTGCLRLLSHKASMNFWKIHAPGLYSQPTLLPVLQDYRNLFSPAFLDKENRKMDFQIELYHYSKKEEKKAKCYFWRTVTFSCSMHGDGTYSY